MSEESWNKLDDKTKKIVDAHFVSPKEKYEIAYLIEKLKKENPTHSSEKIKGALEECLKTVPAPHPREKLEMCIRLRLKR